MIRRPQGVQGPVTVELVQMLVWDQMSATNFLLFHRNLSAIQDREICCYSVSCKEKDNIGTDPIGLSDSSFYVQDQRFQAQLETATVQCLLKICYAASIIAATTVEQLLNKRSI